MADVKLRVLFLCVHNSARSQMAEALLRKHGGDAFVVESAGFEHKSILPAAVEAMKQVGVDISAAASQSVFDLFRAGRIYDYVVTVCDEASAERCPIFPGVCERLHWTFPDPSLAETEAERVSLAAAVRDQIDARIRAWLRELEGGGGQSLQFNKRET